MSTTSTRSVLVVGVPPESAEAESPAPGPLSIVEQVDRHLPGPGLVLVHDDRPEQGERGDRARDAAVAKAALGRDEVVIHSVAGPLSRFLLVSQTLEAMQAPLGVVAASVDRAMAGARTTALLASVTRLDDPIPTLSQHARSLLPGGCFLVDGGTVQAVKHRLPRGMGRGAAAAVVTGEGDVGDWPDRLWAALGPVGDQPEPLVLPGPSCWGTTRWAEISVLNTTTADLAAQLDRAPTRTCSWCARLVARDQPCPFCDSRPAAARRPAPDQPEDDS
jgi:hypothetical protein